MMTHKEIHQRIPDYVLGLLTPGQAQEVSQHLARCAACRRTVHVEREIGVLVRDSINVTTRPNPAQLRQLMPPVPQKSRQAKIATTWTARLAPALVLLLDMVGGLLMSAPDSKRPVSIFFGVTATATSTNTPTATVAQESSSGSGDGPAVLERITTGTAPSEIGPPIQVVVAPSPLQSPTPIAASIHRVAN